MKKTLAIFAVSFLVLIVLIVLHDKVEAHFTSNNTTYVGTVISVENEDGLYMIVGNRDNNQNRLKLILTEATKIYDKNGKVFDLSDIKIGNTVRVRHSEMMTKSLPVQTIAYSISLLKAN